MRFFLIASCALGLSTLSVLSAPAGAQSAVQPKWTYTGKYGPVNWSKLNPDYGACNRGREQSPIDIRGARLNSQLQPIQIHFVGAPATLVNNGRAIVVHGYPGSFVLIDGVRYNLVDYTFHHPSEHAVNGDYADMEVDFLTRSADGKQAMLAVFLSESSDFPNATVSMLWPHLPTPAGETETDNDMVDPGGLFPTDPGYWTYTGSLPDPPCTEGVQWYVYQSPVSISRSQLNTFISLFRMNTRPLQDTHGRRIQANE